ARPLSDGDLNGAAQRSCGGFAFSAAICELTVESPQLGLEIALVAAVCPREPLACGGSSLGGLRRHAAEPGREKGGIRAGGGSPRRYASAPPTARSSQCHRPIPRRRPASPEGPPGRP